MQVLVTNFWYDEKKKDEGPYPVDLGPANGYPKSPESE